VLAVFLTGMLWRRATGPAAVIALIGGIATSVGLYALNQPAVYLSLGLEPLFQISEPFLYFSVWAFLVSLSLIVVCSYLTRPSAPEKSRLVVGWKGDA
jgi:solute:Na+ symporter, SSS family